MAATIATGARVDSTWEAEALSCSFAEPMFESSLCFGCEFVSVITFIHCNCCCSLTAPCRANNRAAMSAILLSSQKLVASSQWHDDGLKYQCCDKLKVCWCLYAGRKEIKTFFVVARMLNRVTAPCPIGGRSLPLTWISVQIVWQIASQAPAGNWFQ